MTSCPGESVLRRFLTEGGLPGAEARAVESHVSTCADCQKTLGQLTGDLFDLPVPGEAGGEKFTLAGYQVLGEIARGVSATLYLARDTTRHRPAVIKVLTAAGKKLLRFAAEMQAIKTLRHPHVVTALDYSLREKQSYIVMEFAEGGSLAQRQDGKPWPPRAAAELLLPLAEAVRAAHAHGILHRDLKPGNVLLFRAEPGPGDPLPSGPAQGWVPKLADFGLAKVLAESVDVTTAGDVLGTPSYMAPEQARGEKELDFRSDVFALGAMLYDLLTGRPPFVGQVPLDTLFQVVHQEPVPVTRLQPKVPRDLETICLKCLEKDRRARYAGAGALAEDLRLFLAGQPVKARPPSRLTRARRWVGRNRGLAAVGAVALVLLLVLAVGGPLAAWRQSRLRTEAEAEQRRAEQVAGLSLDVLGLLSDPLDVENPTVNEEDLPLGLRRALAERVVPYVNRVLELGADARPARAVEARAYLGKARLGSLLGRDFDDFLKDCRRAQALYAELLAGEPGNASYRRGLATALSSEGALLGMQGKRAAALAALRAAQPAWEQLVADHPDEVVDRYRLGLCLNNLGNVLRAGLDAAAARAAYGAAAGEFGRLRDADPTRFLYRDWLSRALGNRGLLALGTGNLDGAEPDLRQAEALAASLVHDFPTWRRARECHFAALVNLGELYGARNDHAGAEQAFTRALTLYEPLVRDHPLEVEYRWGRALALASVGLARGRSGRLKEARESLAEAVHQYAELARGHADQARIAEEHREFQQALADVERGLSGPGKAP